MTTLAANKPRAYELGERNDLDVIGTDIIYEGAAVGDNGTNVHRPLVAGDRFVGFAVEKVDNSAGASGAKQVRVQTKGRIQLPISNFDVTDVGKPVYASDDDTFTLTQSTNSHIGKAVRFVATGSVIVEFNAHNPPPGLLTELTDNSGGTASDTIAVNTLTDNSGGTANGTLAAIEATYTEATIENNFADVAARINTLADSIASVAAKVNSLIRQSKG